MITVTVTTLEVNVSCPTYEIFVKKPRQLIQAPGQGIEIML